MDGTLVRQDHDLHPGPPASSLSGITTIIFVGSLATAPFIKKNFMSSSDFGDFNISLQMPSGTSLDGTNEVANRAAKRILAVAPEVNTMSIIVGMNAMNTAAAQQRHHGPFPGRH